MYEVIGCVLAPPSQKSTFADATLTKDIRVLYLNLDIGCSTRYSAWAAGEAKRHVHRSGVQRSLVRILPMDDVMFTAQLYQRDLLPGDSKAEMESKCTRAKKAEYFLDHVIQPTLRNSIGSFNKLLKVMEDSEYDNVKELAKLITTRLMGETTNNAG